ncbi:MAG: hypothetical protein EBT27_01270 [Betaproteobacteria bacterium]|nr:hypothetical protein [Betaproteobacteria bacterium]
MLLFCIKYFYSISTEITLSSTNCHIVTTLYHIITNSFCNKSYITIATSFIVLILIISCIYVSTNFLLQERLIID